MTRAAVWKFLSRQSNHDLPELQSGYSLLLPVPGDLPVFLKIALEGCNAQTPEGLIETLILPDRPSRQLENLLHIWAKRYVVSPLRLLNAHPFEQVMASMHSIPLIDLQLTRGIQATQASYAMIHSVGEFAIAPDFRQSQYLASLGQRPSEPNKSTGNGLTGQTTCLAPDQSVIEVQNFKRSPLWSTFNPMAGRLQSNALGLVPAIARSVVRFSGLLPAYRHYQHTTGSVEDGEFHLLLMRLLIDAYDQSGRSYYLPLIDDLIRGITDSTARITYGKAQTRQQYPHFRHKVQQILESGLLDPMKAAIMQDELSLFERVWGTQ